MSTLLRRTAAAALEQARVAIPAVVVSFDAAKATCSAQPLIRHPLPDGGERADPALAGVPVLYPGTATSRVRFPLAKGDTVLLIFLDRASDEWALSLLLPEATSPREKSPAERRFHDITDAVAIPIATTSPADRPVDADRMVLEYDGVQLDLTAAGTVLAHTGTASEAVALATKADLQALVNYLLNTGLPVVGGGGGVAKGTTTTPAGTSVLKGK